MANTCDVATVPVAFWAASTTWIARIMPNNMAIIAATNTTAAGMPGLTFLSDSRTIATAPQ
ncbi:hypothetical protein D3C83_310230 [compost metagenome]